MICKDFPACVASCTGRFWVWALEPQPEAFHESPVLHGPLKSASSRHLLAFCCSAKGGDASYSAWKTHRIPGDDDTYACGRFQESRLAHACWTSHCIGWQSPVALPSRPFVTERRTCWPVSDACWTTWGRRSPPLFQGTTSCTPCLRRTGDQMLLATLTPCCCSSTPRRHGFVHALSLLLWIARGRTAVTKLIPVAQRPALCTMSSPTCPQPHREMWSFIFLIEIVSIKVTPALPSMGSTYSAFVRGCLDVCDLSGGLLGLWSCQDFVASVGEGDGTGWLDTVLHRVLGYVQNSGCCCISDERCPYVPPVVRNGDTSDHRQWHEASRRHLCRRIL